MRTSNRELFDQFIRDKQYLDNIADSTVQSYTLAFNWFEKLGGDFTREALDGFVIGLRKSGMNPGGCNVKIRAINAFLSWCHNHGHCERLRIKILRHKEKVPYQLSDAHVRALIKFRPQGRIETRLHVLVMLLLDTGIRIDEALTLESGSIDLDNLVLRVVGKGNKERIVPFSLELRKTLFKFIRSHENDLVFSSRHGLKLSYQNVRRDLDAMTKRMGFRCGFHDFRRFFATNFIKMGGNPMILQRILGHASLAVTQRYVRLVTDDLSFAHKSTSALSRFRR